jgi:hypothetical protein
MTMRSSKHIFSFFLLVLVASLAAMPNSYHKDLKEKTGHGIAALFRHQQVRLVEKGGDSFQVSVPGLPRRVEKRHGKSLLSQAIVAGYAPVLQPDYSYCHRKYSLFLPGGCARQMIGNFSLRGPPSLV